MTKTTVRKLYKQLNNYISEEVSLSGWVRTIRDSKVFGFIELNDGTYF